MYIKEGIILIFGIVIGAAIAVVITIAAIFIFNKDKEKIINHRGFQGVLAFASFLLAALAIYYDRMMGLIIVPYMLGFITLLRLKFLPYKCKDSNNKEMKCYDVRCDYTILKTYNRISYSLFILGALLTIVYFSIYLYKNI